MSKINKIRLSGTDYDIQDVSATSVVEVTQQQYDDLPASAKTDNILYIITDSTVDYVTSAQTQSAITQAVSGKVDTSTYTTYTAATATALNGKQDTLVSSSNIKTINNESLLGSGNIDIQGGNSVVELTQAAYDALVTGGTVDPDTFYIITDATPADISQYWTSAQTQSAITQAVSGKQDTLVSGTNIKTINNESILGSGNIDIQGGSTYTASSGITIDSNNVIGLDGHFKIVSNNAAQIPSAIGDYIHIGYEGVNIGYGNAAKGQYSLAVGSGNEVGNNLYQGQNSMAVGSVNTTLNDCEFASGRYNNSVSASITFGDSGNTLFSVGNGTADDARHNAFEIKQNGDIYLTKDGQDVKLQDQLGGGGSITIDPTLNTGSTNAVANSAITNAINAVSGAIPTTYVSNVRSDASDGTTRFFQWEKNNNGSKSYTTIWNFKINNNSVLTSSYNGGVINYNLVETSAITTSVTSSSTDAQVPSAKAVNDKLGGLSLVRLTQAEYNALSPNYDSNTLYVING